MTTRAGSDPMTTRTDGPAPTIPLMRLLRSERRKITSTKTWWLFGIGVVVTGGLALAINIGQAYSDFTSATCSDDGTCVTQAPTDAVVRTHAANIFTSGQYFGGLFVLLLAILLITNEYYHQTATSTFLATPRRTYVVVSKFIMAMIAAAVVWVVTTVIDLVAGIIFLNSQHVSTELGTWQVQRSIAINLLMFALWGVFGIGLAALLRSQIGATVTASLLYTVGIYAALAVFAIIRTFVYHHDSVFKGMVVIPAIAAQVAEGSLSIPGDEVPRWWVGVLVMVIYGVVMATIGTLILRKRDIS